MTNWIDCIRTNKTPNASVEICHRSAVACHMANLAYRQKTAHHPTEPEFVGTSETKESSRNPLPEREFRRNPMKSTSLRNRAVSIL